MSLVGYAGVMNNTVKAGFGAGYNHIWSTAYSISQSTTVKGNVSAPKNLCDVPMFKNEIYSPFPFSIWN
jgi:hypothetical protein